jgi:L-asparagine transporter-like permease
MIAIGGVIGAGLFVGSGAVIAEVGPAAFITYALTGVLIIMVMRMLGGDGRIKSSDRVVRRLRPPVTRRVGWLLGRLALLVLLGDRRGL